MTSRSLSGLLGRLSLSSAPCGGTAASRRAMSSTHLPAPRSSPQARTTTTAGPSSSPTSPVSSLHYYCHHNPPSAVMSSSRSFHATVAPAKPGGSGHSQGGSTFNSWARGGQKKRKKGYVAPDPRIINLKKSMPRKVPAPLRFARNRHLRHWTIHRAWLLFQRKEREREERELERMYRSMHNACEELRHTSGPGLRDEGFLYRVALEKKGVYGHNAVPIEYARLQTETPARVPWNHDWTPS
ncbi:hypothetical protein GGR56DRAFT_616503 [Xylariaceae sp. FL0804]|nr:hypothetical protein GGR56DRAFT_616503 [Xylariaceae sp. FL0804]